MNREELNSNTQGTGETDLPEQPGGISRRSFLQAGAIAGSGAALAALSGTASAQNEGNTDNHDDDRPNSDRGIAFASIAELQDKMRRGHLSSKELVEIYLRRIRDIDRGLDLSAILEINPDAKKIANDLDQERRHHGPRGPLHGIPILLKDNIDTGDKQHTTAGSLALFGASAPQDATVAKRLRQAGAVILGKANLSEWANFRGFGSSSGWSGVGGQCRNPHILDRNPCGSSSGSGAAVAAALTAVALGTETDGSVVCPTGQNGIAGIKPTVGLTSRAGVVPISHTQDTVGCHGRTLADAATVLGALTGVDPRDPATSNSAGHFQTNYRQFINPNGLAGARIGVGRQFTGVTTETDAVFEAALEVMSNAGATLVDVTIPSLDEYNASQSEIIVLIFEFKRDLNAYLASRTGVPAQTLAEVIQFNSDHADQELRFFGQELMELAEAEVFDEATYLAALADGPRLGAVEGIDATLAANNVDCIVAPTNTPAWPNDLVNGDAFLFGSSGLSAVAGYPIVVVTGGFAFDLPIGLSFLGTAWSEPSLIKIASGYEAQANVRRRPRFLRTLSEESTFSGAGSGSNGSGGSYWNKSSAHAKQSRSSAKRAAQSKFDRYFTPSLRKPTSL